MTLSILLAAASGAVSAPVFVQRACADAQIDKAARCGSVSVPEHRSKPGGRTIELNVVVLPAPDATRRLPPLFDIDGGPGLPVTKNAGFYLSVGGAYRNGRDIVLVDQRGTGGSNPLHCPALARPEAAYAPLYPAEEVAACRKALEAKADLTRYGTSEAVADLDAVRAALGYHRIDLFGLSYGTTVALRYLSAYPQRVRAAVLMGVAPTTAMPPSQHAPGAESAFGLLASRCAADSACAAKFKPAADLDRALARLSGVKDAPSRDVFLEKLRTLMYQPASARRLPFILHRAGEGDLAPFFAATKPRGPSPYADGMYLSVTCAEGLGLMNYEAAAAASRATRFGDYRLRRQRAACAEWPTAKVAADHLAPVISDAAVLLLSGELDPVSPPAWADEVARRLPNSRHLVIPNSGHIFDGMSSIDTCLDPTLVKFLDRAEPNSIDAACLATMQPPPFQTSAEPARPDG